MARRGFALLVLAVLAACSGSAPDAADLRALVAAAPAVLAAHDGEVPSSRWPVAMQRLHPERVIAREEGLYVATSSRFVTERGVFVPRDPSFVPHVGTDPAYAPLGRGVFSYRIEG